MPATMSRPKYLPDNFTLALLATVLLASLVPATGVVALGFEWLTTAAIALLFFLHGAKLSRAAVIAGMEAGIVALYQKCPHLGCRVPECATSQWFECPCHGSQFNRVGEKKGGPAPRGMDRFGVSVANGIVVVDTGSVFGGPPIGTNTTGQEAEGPHCVGGGSH